MKKRTVLLRFSVLAEVDETEVEKDHGEVDRLEDAIEDAINAVIGVDEDAVDQGWESTYRLVLDEENMNCGRCVKCGAWTTDLEREEPIKGLQFGASVDGDLLCDEHLPQGHRFAF